MSRSQALFDGGVVHPLPDTDVVMYPGRVDKFETVVPGRGFVRVISDPIRTVEQYVGVSIEIGEGLATCTTLDFVWTISSMMWEHLKSGWLGTPEELIRQEKIDCDRQVVLLSEPYRRYREQRRSGVVHVSQHHPSLVRQAL